MNLKKLFQLTALAACVLLPATTTHAAIPKLLTYHGLLKSSSGSYLTGSYSMTFKIYTAATGGSSIWSETQPAVSVSSGKFSVQLGSVTALNSDFSTDYWLSIKVGADPEMSPRIRVTSSGYSLMSNNVVNAFSQAQHDALSHKNVEGVKDNTVNIAKTNFKLDAYSAAAANSLGDMILDTFNDASGIAAGSSTNYAWRATPYYDVVAAPTGGTIDSNVSLVLHANGADGSTTFTDSSLTPKTVNASGNAQMDTAQSKFGGASGLFDGSGDYLTTSDSDSFHFGTGDFTIDVWARLSTTGHSQFLMSQYNGSLHASNFLWWDNAGYLITDSTNSSSSLILQAYCPWTPAVNTWYHIALVRTAGTFKIFINGVSQTVTTPLSGAYENIAGTVYVGRNAVGSSSFEGWMDELRVSKGVARWTANFTPPTSEYTTGTPGTATVVSTAFAEPVAPTEAMIIPDESLNGGTITYYVSRNNGTTWTQCTKETVTNISAQPTGTQVKWKAVITGNAELNSIAVAV